MFEAASEYQRRYNISFIDKLGEGKDGNVLTTFDSVAVKFFYDESIYRRELRAYQILKRRDIDEINGFQIPRFLQHDDELRAIEMTVVEPPFVLDFASAYTADEYVRMEFTEEVMAERETHWAEIFGERWDEVQSLCFAFSRETGLMLLDLSLNNIRFENA